MRGAQVTLALLAAGTLTLGTGSAFAQQSTATTSSTATSSSAATTPEMPAAPAASREKKMTTGTDAKAKGPVQVQKREGAREAQEEKGEHEVTPDRVYRGQVTAIDTTANPRTLVMQTYFGKQPATIGVDVPAATRIMEGKAEKALADIKVGDTVVLRYDRRTDRLVADQIRILPTGSVAATKAERSGGSAEATPAAAKAPMSHESY